MFLIEFARLLIHLKNIAHKNHYIIIYMTNGNSTYAGYIATGTYLENLLELTARCVVSPGDGDTGLGTQVCVALQGLAKGHSVPASTALVIDAVLIIHTRGHH